MSTVFGSIGELPIADRTIPVEYTLWDLLLKRVFLDFVLVNRDAKSRLGIWRDCLRGSVQCEPFFHDVRSPRDVVVNRLANDVTRL